MRLASFLPMLLLAFSIPVAAQNCKIFDLTATVVQVDPANCQFFVSLDFQHNGTSNDFTVNGNGTNYGLFPYTQVPLILGPFNGNPNNPTILEFVVQDAVVPDCNDMVVLDFPACNNAGICDIKNLQVIPGLCDNSGQHYSLWVNFEFSAVTNSNSFEVWANGTSIGHFLLPNLPILIPAFPASGNPKDIIKICIDGQQNCCEELEFDAPICAVQPCGITNLSVVTGDCLGDSTYKATIDFDLLGPVQVDSFELRSNNQFIGKFGINQLPLMHVITWDGGQFDEIKVCVVNLGAICCVTKEYPAPACLPLIPCGIHDLVVNSDTCTSDSTFRAILNFAVNDPAAVDSFDLWANGQFLGHFGMNQLPLNIPDFRWNGLIFSYIRVCTGNSTACCKEYQFLNPACLPYGPCQLTDIFLQPGACTSDSTYKITVDFNGTNPGNGTFTLSIHNQLIDTFNLTQLPLMLEVPWNGQAADTITVCILDSIPAIPNGCCRIKQFAVPTCILPCSIFNVALNPGNCDLSTNTYEMNLNFGVNNPGNGFFEVWGNGTYIDSFPLASLPIVIPNFPANGNAPDVIKICIKDNADCCKTIDFQGPNCDPPCKIFDVLVIPGNCIPGSDSFTIKLDFGVQNPGDTIFEVWGNGTYLGEFPIAGLPMLISNFPANGNALDVIKICIKDHPDCCQTIDFQGPNCTLPCEVFDVVVDPGACNPNSNTYNLLLNFQVQNPGNALFEVWGNGTYLGMYPLASLPLLIPNFPGNGNALDEIKICIKDHPDCCRTLNFQGPNCDLPCDIFDLTVVTGNCNGDSTYEVTVNFQVQNPTSNTFGLWANGQLFGNYDLSQLPLFIPNFPWSGGNNDEINVCLTTTVGGQDSCCAEIVYPAPSCLFNAPCHIFDLTATAGNCNPNDPTYPLTINFGVNNPGNDFFEVWVNNVYFGAHLLSSLPYTIPNAPSNGNAGDIIKVCINDHPDCCQTIEIQGPDCNSNCEIFNVVLSPGDCIQGTTNYNLLLNFQVANPGSNLFEVWGNSTYLGLFPLAALPLNIPNFPSNGPGLDVIKICIQNNPDCCKTIDFQGPNCNINCEIFNVVLDPGDCIPGTTNYNLHLNFQVANPGNDFFEVWGNGLYLGLFPLAGLPMIIPNFPSNGPGLDVIKICIQNNQDCCKTIEFQGPDCVIGGNCEIFNLSLQTGNCNVDSTYQLLINFQVVNPSSNIFRVWANGQVLGEFNLNQLPLLIQNFPWDGGNIDVIKVCMLTNVPSQPPCCIGKEFQAPSCLFNDPCHIFDLTATAGNCNPNESTYPLTINFGVNNPGNDFFEVWVNNVYFGTHLLSSLPFTIPNAPSNGNAGDIIKVCINDHPDCCQTIEIQGPNCNGNANCEIFNVVLDPGDCIPGTTNYNLHLNFQVANPGSDFFEVWGNGLYLGVFPLAGLPMIIPNFPSNGPGLDVIKICIQNNADCCKTIDFQGPDCVIGGNCEIFNLTLQTGNCTGDSSYQLLINFQVVNPPSNIFRVWANGQVLGDFNLNQLPLLIQNFPWSGGNLDAIKVCIVSNVPNQAPCCIGKEFQVPSCLGNNDCHIYDLVVVHTPCLCGQFFAILTFKFEGGVSGSFDIMGNGNNYGNYPYSTPQPIILGPFIGDGTTMYNFVVKDHEHPNLCNDEFNLGKVECMIPVIDPSGGNAMLTLSPNPTANWLNVTALLENGATIGQANVEVYATDGRLVQTNTVANGANFQLDVSNLPSGVFRIVLKSDAGRLEGTFAKQ